MHSFEGRRMCRSEVGNVAGRAVTSPESQLTSQGGSKTANQYEAHLDSQQPLSEKRAI
jgi:hypothetical protein